VHAFADRALAGEPPGIDALVLPENLLTAPVDASRELAKALEEWISSLGVPILTGVAMSPAVPDPTHYRSSVLRRRLVGRA
jgi:hypothetical protein